MKLIDRVGHWLRAESHGVVDAIEDRGLLLKQALREAELALEGKREEARSLKGREKELLTFLERAREEAEALDADVELALEQEQDELARFAARKLLPLRQRITESERGLVQVREAHGDLEDVIRAQSHELDALRCRVREHLQRIEAGIQAPRFEPAVSDEDVELELLRRRRKRGGA